MRQLLPAPADDVDVDATYAGDPRPVPAGRPWLMVNMVSSLDGGTAIDGRSGGLGGPGDRRVFHAVRAVADFVLVGAGTVRAESYGPPRLPEPLQAARVARGQARLPRIAVVSGRLDLDLTTALFTESDPVVITAPTASAARRTEIADRADLVLAGQGPRVDLDVALKTLADLGAGVVLCEGGPTLNGELLARGLIDELCLTLAPLLVGGDSRRAVVGARPDVPATLRLARVLEADGTLFLRYAR